MSDSSFANSSGGVGKAVGLGKAVGVARGVGLGIGGNGSPTLLPFRDSSGL